jgi:hypothetical protein
MEMPRRLFPKWKCLRRKGQEESTVRPGKKPANTGVILTNEKTQVSESESHLWKKVDRK